MIFFSRLGISNLESRKAVGNMILSIRARGRSIGLLLIYAVRSTLFFRKIGHFGFIFTEGEAGSGFVAGGRGGRTPPKPSSAS